MNLKYWLNIFQPIVNSNLIAQLVIQVKNGIMTNFNVSVKFITPAKKIIVGILAHIFMRAVGIF